MTLLDWTARFIENIDMYKKELVRKEIFQDRIMCFHKDGKESRYYVEPLLTDSVLTKINNGSINLVCLNSKANLVFLIKNWSKFIKNLNLKVIFVNPEQNLQWSVKPYLHNKLADADNLKLGLKTIFDSVPSV